MIKHYEWLEDKDECLRVNEEVLRKQAVGFSKQTYGIGRDELIQQARIALTKAWEKFKADAGSDFDGYARFIIQQALKKLRKEYKASQSSSSLSDKEIRKVTRAEKELKCETLRPPTMRILL
jgi:Sigma-70 region 2.